MIELEKNLMGKLEKNIRLGMGSSGKMEKGRCICMKWQKKRWGLVLGGIIFLSAGLNGEIFCKEKKIQGKTIGMEEDRGFLEQNCCLNYPGEGNLGQEEIEEVAGWIKEELFFEQEEELADCFRNPSAELSYAERRGTEDFQVTVVLNEKEQYQVLIPENLYSERKINDWLQRFYIEDARSKDEFLGIIITDSEYMSAEMRKELGFFYSTSVQRKRADDAVISFFINTFYYMGGVHGFDSSDSVNFDTKKGKVLELEDIVLDLEVFYEQVKEFIEGSYRESKGESMRGIEAELMEEALQKGWYLNGYGICFFVNGYNGSGFYTYAVPYERIVDYIRPEYLPVSKEAEWYLDTEEFQMDVNGDGVLDWIVFKNQEIVINGVSSVLEEKGIDLAENEEIGSKVFLLVRDREGMTRLECKIEISENGYKKQLEGVYKLIYRIEGERAEFVTEES